MNSKRDSSNIAALLLQALKKKYLEASMLSFRSMLTVILIAGIRLLSVHKCNQLLKLVM